MMPFVMQVAIGRRPVLEVFGNDYPTRDGTAIRDYIHVVDLARAHVAATDDTGTRDGVSTFNLGTGVGSTVLEILSAASDAVGHEIPYEIVGRRDGDVAEVYADPSYAAAELGWRAERNVKNMVTGWPIAAAPLAITKEARTRSRSPEKTTMVWPFSEVCFA